MSAPRDAAKLHGPVAVATPVAIRALLPEGAPGPTLKASNGAGQPPVGPLDPASFEADQYRVLRHALSHSKEVRVIAVTSPVAGDGKTTTAIHLAATLARTPGTRTLLIDADLRLSSAGARLGLAFPGARGLGDCLLDDRVALEEVENGLPGSRLSVLTAGRPVPHPCDTLQSPRLAALLQEARRRYDHVVVDSPPLLPVPDSRLIAGVVDGIILVVAAHRTTRRSLAEAFDALDPRRVVGVVFNDADPPPLRAYGGYYYGRPAAGAAPAGGAAKTRVP